MSERRFEQVCQPEGWVSASPLPSRDELRRFYAELYYQDPQSTTYRTEYDALNLQYKRLKCDALLHALAAHGLTRGCTFLDVGAGEGFLMRAASERGLRVTGADFSSFAVGKFFPALAGSFIEGDVFDTIDRLAAEGAAFDGSSAINVLEHVLDPDALLRSIRRLLAPRGLLAITVPNDFSRLQALLKREGRLSGDVWFVPPQHLHYFNADTLPRFCEARGYTLVDAFADFPIDLYLLHPGSDYVADAAKGPAAHRARMLFDLLVADAGLDRYLDMYRALFTVGIGRDLTVILRRSE